jgi:exodeoxyribonuclease VII large subunit
MDKTEQLLYIDDLRNNINHKMKSILVQKEVTLNNIIQSFSQHSLENKFLFIQKQIDDLKQNFNHYFRQILNQKQSSLELLTKSLDAQNPKNKNFGNMVQLSKDGKPTTLDNIKKDDKIHLQTSIYDVVANIISKKKL